MRNTVILLSLAACLLILAACGTPVANDPASVAKAFLERIGKFDFGGAKELATEDGKKVLATMEGLMGMSSADELKKAKEESAQNVITIGQVDEQGDKATVMYSSSDKADQTLELAKENGQWKVNFKKEL